MPKIATSEHLPNFYDIVWIHPLQHLRTEPVKAFRRINKRKKAWEWLVVELAGVVSFKECDVEFWEPLSTHNTIFGQCVYKN
jgi:hypothetical protein